MHDEGGGDITPGHQALTGTGHLSLVKRQRPGQDHALLEIIKAPRSSGGKDMIHFLQVFERLSY